jgi:hypothetical protein
VQRRRTTISPFRSSRPQFRYAPLGSGGPERKEKTPLLNCPAKADHLSVVKDTDRKKGESLLASTPVVVLSAILGRTPTIEEYKSAVKGIKLTQFAPPINKMTSQPSHLLTF